jgi:type II secretory ATPase GspE/PulE/Tfp pilus assembly ATPase PilB-like protein
MTPHEELLHELQLTPEQANNGQYFKAKGCSECHGTGYRGRTGVYEVFSLTPRLRKMILDRNSTAELKVAAIEEGMLTLRRDALRKMLLGDTTPEEVLRETATD